MKNAENYFIVSTTGAVKQYQDADFVTLYPNPAASTVGISTPEKIASVFSSALHAFPDLEFGGHFHTTPWEWQEKVEAAYQNGCMRFDGAIKGYGGCPMAKDDLIGNMPTERLIEFFGYEKLGLKKAPFEGAFKSAETIFNRYS